MFYDKQYFDPHVDGVCRCRDGRFQRRGWQRYIGLQFHHAEETGAHPIINYQPGPDADWQRLGNLSLYSEEIIAQIFNSYSGLVLRFMLSSTEAKISLRPVRNLCLLISYFYFYSSKPEQRRSAKSCTYACSMHHSVPSARRAISWEQTRTTCRIAGYFA